MLSNARASCRMMCDHLGTIGGPYVGNGTAQFRACGPRALGTSYWLSPGARGPQGSAQGLRAGQGGSAAMTHARQ